MKTFILTANMQLQCAQSHLSTRFGIQRSGWWLPGDTKGLRQPSQNWGEETLLRAIYQPELVKILHFKAP